MEIDREKIDQMTLALMYLVIHDEDEYGARAWKGFDWDTLNRLHQKGLIGDPVNRAKSVRVTAALCSFVRRRVGGRAAATPGRCLHQEKGILFSPVWRVHLTG